MIRKAAYGPGGLAVDPVFAQQWRVRLRLDPGPKLDAALLRFEFDRDSEAAASPVACTVAQFRPAQATSRRKQREGFEEIGFARTIVSGEHDEARVNGKIERGIGAEIGEREPPHACLGEGFRGRARRGRLQRRSGHCRKRLLKTMQIVHVRPEIQCFCASTDRTRMIHVKHFGTIGAKNRIRLDHQRSGRGARSQSRHKSLRGHQSLRCDDRYKIRRRQAKFARTFLPFAVPFRSLAGYARSAVIPPRCS